MQQYTVTGMHCAACSASVEKAVKKVPGVTSCAVSLLTNSMGVEGTAEPAAIIKAVEDAGYGASVRGQEAAPAADASALEDRQTPHLKKRLIASVAFLLILMYFSMGHMMWGWPLPGWFSGNHVAMGLVQLLLAGIVMVINQEFFVSGTKSLLRGSPNMDTLVSLGAAASYGWSVYALFAMTDAQLHGGSEAAMAYMDEFYFESAAMILTLITVGKLLEAHSKGKTTDALKSLMALAPETATVIRDGKEVKIPAAQVRKGDVFVVRPGQSIPVDGVVLDGASAVNEAALTGESVPVDKAPGDGVSAATVNCSGFLRCEATRVGEDTTLSQIIRMVADAAATKAPIAKTADKVAGVFVPAVISIALVTTIVWLLLGREFSFALARGISVLVISCPCALGLATPVAIMVGSGVGAKNGILFKTAASLEHTGRTRIVTLDKTGTITSGQPEVTDLIPADGVTERELLQAAVSLEAKSEHPLAAAIMKRGEEEKLQPEAAEKFAAITGSGLTAPPFRNILPIRTGFFTTGCGLTATVLDAQLLGGSVRYMASQLALPQEIHKQADALSQSGKTPLLFAKNGKLLGLIAVADAIKPESPEAIRQLRGMGIRVVMLTGDNQRTADAIGRLAGVDDVVAGVLPGGKEAVVRELQKYGPVAMVGDGINDAPALTAADTGIAIGAGADVAIDAADVVLMKSTLLDVAAAIRLSRAALRNIHENLFWAFIYNVIGIPLAAGVFVGLGLTLNPMYGAAAMSLSSFCVVSNALRLNLCRLYSSKHDHKGKPMPEIHLAEQNKEETGMTKTLHVKGMMCGHCEARVKKALEAVDGVASAVADHNNGTAVVTLTKDVSNETLKAAVEAQDYEVTGVE